ncbi:Uncharacterized protein Fot_35572 [Forsythia ovata]|uniref:Uncharacterized protein n=1 Tax=Forsythia ovata TaxID=205694 RepID=A0ABD1SLX0_9LAMI
MSGWMPSTPGDCTGYAKAVSYEQQDCPYNVWLDAEYTRRLHRNSVPALPTVHFSGRCEQYIPKRPHLLTLRAIVAVEVRFSLKEPGNSVSGTFTGVISED